MMRTTRLATVPRSQTICAQVLCHAGGYLYPPLVYPPSSISAPGIPPSSGIPTPWYTLEGTHLALYICAALPQVPFRGCIPTRKDPRLGISLLGQARSPQPPHPAVNRMTDARESITFPELLLRMVITVNHL